MARWRQNLTGGDGPTLKDIRDALILRECTICNRRDGFERKVLVQQFGLADCLMKLRRRLAMGCERMGGPRRRNMPDQVPVHRRAASGSTGGYLEFTAPFWLQANLDQIVRSRT